FTRQGETFGFLRPNNWRASTSASNRVGCKCRSARAATRLWRLRFSARFFHARLLAFRGESTLGPFTLRNFEYQSAATIYQDCQDSVSPPADICVSMNVA